MTAPKPSLVAELAAYLRRYLAFPNDGYPVALALWVMMTYLWDQLDAVPYLVITAATKRSGKTRLMELLTFVCRNPRTLVAPTPASIYRTIGNKKIGPTLFADEAEVLSSETAGALRAIVNAGYRRGQTVTRADMSTGSDRVFNVYCPKVFVLIGDVFDTLRDRSIVVTMQRAEAPMRFVYGLAKDEGTELAARCKDEIKARRVELLERFQRHPGLSWLSDRDEEIWIPLFVLCEVFAPELVDALTGIASDMSTAKTNAVRRYTSLKDAETATEDDEYAVRLVRDLAGLLGARTAIPSKDALAELRAVATAPWRKFRGDEGLTAISMSDLLSRFPGLAPVNCRFKGHEGCGYTLRDDGTYIARGYRREAILAALEKVGPA